MNASADPEVLRGVLDQPAPADGYAARLAATLGLPLLDRRPSAGLVLQYRESRLCLVDMAPGGPGPVCVDFAEPRLRHRLARATPRSEAVARAVGLSGRPGLAMVDATGGLGMDSFVLASLGAQVTVLERHPVVFELLRDGHRRALADPATAEAAGRMALIRADARAWLAGLRQPPQAIYLDPMYPPAAKGGEVKKGMRSLQRLLGPEAAVDALFAAVWRARPQRLVIKRPRRSPILHGEARKFTLQGRHTRFDVYMVAEFKAGTS